MPEHDDLDRLLDSALSTYATPEPGLEDRVLHSLASGSGIPSADQRPRLVRRWRPWAIAVPIAVALAFIFLLHPRRPAPPVNHAQQARQSQAPSIVTVPSEPPTARRSPAPARAVHHLYPQASRASQVAITRTLPKLNIFPSPQPLSPEEQALVAVAAHAPEPVRKSLVDAQAQVDAPITISAIQIQPLQTPGPGHN
jgi:hypothetical protein